MLIPAKYRDNVSKFYLDCVEKLPAFGGGTIATLQDIRRHQRRDSNNAFTKSRFPDNTSIELLFVRMAEVFLLEDTKQLQKGLSKLFPAATSKTGKSKADGDITEFATGLKTSGWKTIGSIVREGKIPVTRTAAFNICQIADLPHEVDYINLEFHKCLSSSVILTFDAHLTSDATKRLLSLHDQTYIAPFRFGGILPWQLLKRGWSEDSVWECAPDEIVRWLNSIRTNVEKILDRFFVGVFLKNAVNGQPRLPSIEVFLLNGSPVTLPELDKWISQHMGWWTSLGFNFHRGMFCDEERAYIWPRVRRIVAEPAHRFIVRNNGGMASVETKEILNGLIVAITLIEMLQLVEKNVEILRGRAFRRKSWRLKSSIRLNEKIQNEAIMLERIVMEFNQNRSWIEYLMSTVSDYKCLDHNIAENLRAILVKAVDHHTAFLTEHLSFCKKISDGFLANVNIAVMYRLQSRAFWVALIGLVLTAIAAFLASVDLYREWDKVKELWHLFEHVVGLVK